jgi:hypothetical protein
LDFYDAPPAALASQAAAARVVSGFLLADGGGWVDVLTCIAFAGSMAVEGLPEGLLVALASTDYLESKLQVRNDRRGKVLRLDWQAKNPS